MQLLMKGMQGGENGLILPMEYHGDGELQQDKQAGDMPVNHIANSQSKTEQGQQGQNPGCALQRMADMLLMAADILYQGCCIVTIWQQSCQCLQLDT